MPILVKMDASYYLVRSNIIEEAAHFGTSTHHVRNAERLLECLLGYHLACGHQRHEEQEWRTRGHKCHLHMVIEARDLVLIEPFSLLKVIFRLPFILHKISRVIRSLKEKECVIKKLQKNV